MKTILSLRTYIAISLVILSIMFLFCSISFTHAQGINEPGNAKPVYFLEDIANLLSDLLTLLYGDGIWKSGLEWDDPKPYMNGWISGTKSETTFLSETSMPSFTSFSFLDDDTIYWKTVEPASVGIELVNTVTGFGDMSLKVNSIFVDGTLIGGGSEYKHKVGDWGSGLGEAIWPWAEEKTKYRNYALGFGALQEDHKKPGEHEVLSAGIENLTPYKFEFHFRKLDLKGAIKAALEGKLYGQWKPLSTKNLDPPTSVKFKYEVLHLFVCPVCEASADDSKKLSPEHDKVVCENDQCKDYMKTFRRCQNHKCKPSSGSGSNDVPEIELKPIIVKPTEEQI